MGSSSRRIARAIAAVLLFTTALVGAGDPAYASGKFKIGDRVEVDDLGVSVRTATFFPSPCAADKFVLL